VVIVSVRILLGITLAALSGGAQASSLVFPGAPAATPSILALKADGIQASDVLSVVELGEPEVTDEKVAAIPNAPEPRHGFMPGPMIIRGGVAGGDFSTPTQVKAPATTATPAPAQATASAVPASGTQKKPTTRAAAPTPAPGANKVK
jgi:hypothetical protein